MAQFFATIQSAGYQQYPDLMVVTVIEGMTPGSPPPRPVPGPRPPGPVDPGYSPPWAQVPVDPGFGVPAPPLGIWGPTDPRPTHPIVLPDPLPPDFGNRPGLILPPAGSPGSPSNPYPPGEVPPHVSTGFTKFHVVVPGVGVIGPFTMGPGLTPPGMPPAVPAGAPPIPPQAPR